MDLPRFDVYVKILTERSLFPINVTMKTTMGEIKELFKQRYPDLSARGKIRLIHLGQEIDDAQTVESADLLKEGPLFVVFIKEPSGSGSGAGAGAPTIAGGGKKKRKTKSKKSTKKSSKKMTGGKRKKSKSKKSKKSSK